MSSANRDNLTSNYVSFFFSLPDCSSEDLRHTVLNRMVRVGALVLILTLEEKLGFSPLSMM